MRFRLIVVGKLRAGKLADSIHDYETRVARYWPLEVIELPQEPSRGRAIRLIQRGEGLRILSVLKAGTVVVCDERGVGMPSDAFARWLRMLREGAADVDLVIGGAFG